MFELASYEPDLTGDSVQKMAFHAIKYKYNTLSLPTYYIKFAKEFLNGTNTKLSALVGYPYGFVPTNIKTAEGILAKNYGADIIEIVVNHYDVLLDTYSNIRNEINAMKNVSENNNLEVRAVINYSFHAPSTVVNLVKFLEYSGVTSVVLSTGCVLDDAFDQLIMVNELQKESKIEIIPASNRWKPEHIDILKKEGIKKIRYVGLHPNALGV